MTILETLAQFQPTRFVEHSLHKQRTSPMTAAEMREQIALEHTQGYIHGIVEVSLSDLINHDLDWLCNHVSRSLTGTYLLFDMSWTIVGYEKNRVFLRVRGNADEALAELVESGKLTGENMIAKN